MCNHRISKNAKSAYSYFLDKLGILKCQMKFVVFYHSLCVINLIIGYKFNYNFEISQSCTHRSGFKFKLIIGPRVLT